MKQITLQQQETLVSLVENNPRLHTGKMDNTFTAKNKSAAWNDVASILNALVGPNRTGPEWCKVRLTFK